MRIERLPSGRSERVSCVVDLEHALKEALLSRSRLAYRYFYVSAFVDLRVHETLYKPVLFSEVIFIDDPFDNVQGIQLRCHAIRKIQYVLQNIETIL